MSKFGQFLRRCCCSHSRAARIAASSSYLSSFVTRTTGLASPVLSAHIPHQSIPGTRQAGIHRPGLGRLFINHSTEVCGTKAHSENFKYFFLFFSNNLIKNISATKNQREKFNENVSLHNSPTSFAGNVLPLTAHHKGTAVAGRSRCTW